MHARLLTMKGGKKMIKLIKMDLFISGKICKKKNHLSTLFVGQRMDVVNIL